INKRLNSELRLPRLLDLILDTVLELTSAERGFILLRDDKGQWQVKAARNIAAAELLPPSETAQLPGGAPAPAGTFSRSIAEHARRRRAIDELNKELARKVASQAVELGELHKEVRSSRAALTVRYNYDNLVGRTPRMLELFRLLDRVTDTALPVVIYGESG